MTGKEFYFLTNKKAGNIDFQKIGNSQFQMLLGFFSKDTLKRFEMRPKNPVFMITTSSTQNLKIKILKRQSTCLEFLQKQIGIIFSIRLLVGLMERLLNRNDLIIKMNQIEIAVFLYSL